MLLDVKILFDEYLRKNFKHKPDVLDFLLNHERKEVCIRNLCDQIQVCEKRSKVKLNFDAKAYKLSIEEVAKMFASAAVNAKVAALVSSVERHRRESEESKYDEIRSVVKGLDNESITKEAIDTGRAINPNFGHPGSEGAGLD